MVGDDSGVQEGVPDAVQSNVPDDDQGNVQDDVQSNVPDDSGDDEPTLKEALEEWEDGQRSAFDDPEPEPDDRRDEMAELQSRLESFEGERGEFEAAVRENLELAEDAHAFRDEVLDRLDQHDYGRLLDHLGDETGADRHVLDMELRMKLLEDPDFRAAADDRLYNPGPFNAMVSELEDDLLEKYPNERDHGLTSAVRAARDVSVPRGEQGEFSEVNWARLDSHQFQAKAREVFAAHRAGRVRGKARKSSAWFTTSPD